MTDKNLTISQIAALLRKKKLSPVELARELLHRIERLQPKLNAFITVTADLALRQAREAEREIVRGEYRGPLHGIPVNLKDLFYTRGIRTTAGSKILRNFVPAQDAAVVERLSAAGAILLGKTNLHEFAYGATSINPHFGSVRNPWDLTRVSGGSSGGSAAAVAAGLSLASLGTDTGGSIRIPASACGIVGLKPTRGRVPLHGVVPLSFSLDHAGPLCRSVEDTAILMTAIAGRDPRDPDSFGARGERFSRILRKGLRGLKVGVPKQYFFERLQPEVRRAVLEAIAKVKESGAEIREVSFQGAGEAGDVANQITVAEAVAFHWRWLRTRPQDYGADLRSRMERGAESLVVTYLHAQEARKAFSAGFDEVMKTVDILAVPTLPVTAPRIDEDEVPVGRNRENVRLALLRLVRPINLTGLPAISVPCGFSSERLPIGLQLIGRRRDEATVLRAAWAYEQCTPWHEQFPSV